jgi:integrase
MCTIPPVSIEETPAGTHRVRWRDVDGRQRARTFKTRTAAENFERTVRVDTDRGLPTARPKPMSLAAWAEQWLTGAHNLRPKTRAVYRETVDALGELGDVALGRLTPAAIDAWLADRAAAGRAPSSVNRDYRVLRRMLNVAHQRGHVLANPIAQVAEPRVPDTEMRFLDAGELERLATTIDDRYRTLVLVAAWGGLRWGEIAALTVARVDAKGARVHVVEQLSTDAKARSEPKTAAGRRWVTLPASVADELGRHVLGRPAGEPVWTMPDGGPLVHNRWRGTVGRRSKDDKRWEINPRGYWCRAVDAAGVAPLRFHDLRHTSVGLAVAAGMHPRVIQARLGHASIEITLGLYGHLIAGIDTTAAADLDQLRTTARRLRAVQ